MTLGEKIQQLRKENGLSQEKFAEKLNVSRQSVSKWELNDSVPDVNKIILISNLFSVSTDYLLKDKQDDNTQPKKNNLGVKILYITSLFLIVIGLFLAVSEWKETCNIEEIVGGVIIQTVGLAALLIGKAICSDEPVPMYIKILNIVFLTFIPTSMLLGGVKGYPLTPYPTTPPEIKLFAIVYALVLGTCIAGMVTLNKKNKFK